MQQISLSERFSRIKAVTADSTESETDFSDNDLIPKSFSNRYSYSNTTNLSFTENVSHEIAESDGEESDEEMLDMEKGWMEHFKKIVQKNRDTDEKHVSLCDKVPQIDSNYPLQCLKSSIDQYNMLSQVSDIVGEDLTTDHLTIERNENVMDIGEDNFVHEITSETSVQEVYSVNTDMLKSDADVVQAVILTEPVQNNVMNNETDIDKNEIIEKSVKNITLSDETDSIADPVQIVVSENERNTDGDERDNESDQSDNKLKSEFESLLNRKSENKLHITCSQEFASKAENEAVIEEDTERRGVPIEVSEETTDESNAVLSEISETSHVIEPLNTASLHNKENENFVGNELNENQNTDREKPDETVLSKLSEKIKSKPVENANEHHESSTRELRNVTSLPKTIESKYYEKIKDMSVLSESTIPKQSKEIIKSKTCLSQLDSKVKNSVQKCNKENMKNTSVVQSKKDTVKVKTLEIKPTFSFPLDELLPPLPAKKRKAGEEEVSAIENAAIPRKRCTSETKQVAVQQNIDSNSVTPHPFIEGDIFHGTVYDSSPKEDIFETFHHQKKNFEDLEVIPVPSSSGINTFENDFDTGMANLMAALQNGNQQVISMFQAALHDQIGSNLEALALKASQGQQISPDSDKKSSAFGFYTERVGSTSKGPDEAGDNLTNEKYDELLDLFVEQCSALVKTDEDRCKLKSLMKVLQKEGDMKFASSEFTPQQQTEPNTRTDTPSLWDLKAISQRISQSESTFSSDQEVELFEGRTLLKGGVEPRHIPKTTVRKSGQDLPKDPRPRMINEKNSSVVKVPLPNFAVDLYGEKRVKKILYLDWDAHFDICQSTSLSQKDPRKKIVHPINSDLKLIVDATKALVESLQISQSEKDMSIESKTVQENTARHIDKTKLIDRIAIPETSLGIEVKSNSTENIKHRSVPVLTTPRKETVTTKVLNSSRNRNSVLHYIDLNKNLTSDLVKNEKKPCIGVVKPRIEQYKPKDTKPSVGIVKPIQVKTPVRPETKSKENTISHTVTNRQSVDMELDFDTEDGEIVVHEGTQIKGNILPLETNRQLVSMVLESESEKGEIRIGEEREFGEKGISMTKSNSGLTKAGQRDEKNSRNNVNISLSDISSHEDGQIDTDLDMSLNKEAPVYFKDRRERSRDKDRRPRHYRTRDRSSSRSSIESRQSHNSRTHTCDEERSYFTHSSTRSGYSSEKAKRRDRSGSRDRRRLRSPSKEKDNSRHKHRHRHHTSRDERSYREHSGRSETSKRHHSLGEEKRKRHKTEPVLNSDQNPDAGEIYFKPATSQWSTSIYGELKSKQKTNIPSTNSSYQNTGDEAPMSDADISKEYHQRFGNAKIVNSNISQSDRLIPRKSTEKEYPSYRLSKSRRKSLEDQQKEVLEDKKFLEKCKQNILGKSSTVSKTPVPNPSAKFTTTTLSESATSICKPKQTSSSFSYSDMLHFADLEEV